MKILAIETSSERGSIALQLDGEPIEQRTEGAQTHSGWVLPAISSLLAQAAVKLSELDVIAFGAGPGAFTGLRLACGVAQGLAFAAERPVVGVGSLEALAFAAGPGLKLVATDARMNELYFAAYAVRAEGVECLLQPSCQPPQMALESLRDFLRDHPGQWAGAGNGFAAYGGLLGAALAASLAGIDAECHPTASAVARLAAQRTAEPAAMAAPIYVRQKVALTTAERLMNGGRA
ncbi:MAG: hypothetical protein RIR70_1068 [Pseudomonadota bacterium]|jgi:tRNA threonylcarbamoyladenosine biosynthesis protein TsaB